MDVVIVESPAKAKTINKYLGPGYKVLASFGHVRDLPAKDGSVRPDADFEMDWEVDKPSQKRLSEIAQAVKGADSLILATDPDREGEAISWHVLEVLRQKKVIGTKPVSRVVFNAITKKAVLDAMANPRQIDEPLVDAYLARRALDYLVGFTLSPVLWRKLPGARSAGRVQSVALRLVCDREADIERFRAEEYWQIGAQLTTPRRDEFVARLTEYDGKRLQRLSVGDKARADEIRAMLEGSTFSVESVEAKPTRRNPGPPFTTSTLQQAASAKLGFSASRTMQVAQRLYEGIDIGGETVGLITYMRTDGVQMAPEAITDARSAIAKSFGERYLPEKPRIYATKAKNAQEAHEAIRPTSFDRQPKDVEKFLDRDQARLYELVWKRGIASQMASAEIERTTVEIVARNGSKVAGLRTTGSVVKFEGFLGAYVDHRDDGAAQDAPEEDDEGARLPEIRAKEDLAKRAIDATQHFTEPPPRYSEASLIKKLEELGIGRPSTYAATLQTLQDREYIVQDKRKLLPEAKGRLVTAFLHNFFERYVEYDFTADLEAKLDLISAGELSWKEVLRDFWKDFSAQVDGTKELRVSEVLDALNVELGPLVFPDKGDGTDPRACPRCNEGRLSLKLGKFGAFVGCSNYPECGFTRQLGTSLSADAAGDGGSDGPTEFGADPATGEMVSLRSGRFGPYVQRGDGKEAKRSSLPKGWQVSEMDLEKALMLLNLPREVGLHPESGKPILAGLGRYGPFLQHDGKYANLETIEDVFTVGLNRAVTVIAEKKEKGGRTGGKPSALATLGEHPTFGGEITVRDGRFGAYVNVGKINATLPKGKDPASVTLEEAIAIINDRAEKTGVTSADGGKGKAKKAAPKAKADAEPKAEPKAKAAAKAKAPAKPKAPSKAAAEAREEAARGPAERKGVSPTTTLIKGPAKPAKQPYPPPAATCHGMSTETMVKRAKGPDLQTRVTRETVLRFIAENPDQASKRDIAKAFGIKGSERIHLKDILGDLAAEGAIAGNRRSFQRPGALPDVGVLEIRGRDDDGGLLAEPVGWDEAKLGDRPRLPVRQDAGRGPVAGIGERILAKIEMDEAGERFARVIRVLEKRKTVEIGVFRAKPGGGGRVEPVERKQLEYVVAPGDEKGATDGDLVEVEPAARHRYGLPSASVISVVGSMKSERAISTIALHAHSIPHVFPKAVLDEAEVAGPAPLQGREDWRDLPLVTIDPADAKDHDDAVHAMDDPDPANPGGMVVTVAIADVSWYVRPGSKLDAEALLRGNSVYFPDRVVPMLPERISNDLCSLREGVDRPALAVRMVLGGDGLKRSHRFHRIMMRSHAKLAYEAAQAAHDGTPNEVPEEIARDVLGPLWKAYGLAKRGRDKRQPLDLDLPERKIRLDEMGRVAKVYVPERLDAHRLIEEFMILANVAAAEALESARQALIYRAHDSPSLAKLEALRDFLRTLEIPLAQAGALRPSHFNGILSIVRGGEHENLVNEVVLRSQSQAIYTPENIGHFGLNLARYAHFTSPIRRYADLVVHRALVTALGLGEGGLSAEDEERLEATAEAISRAERRAMAAERDTVDRLIAHHLADRIGDEFDARIAGVTKAGLFVALPAYGADGFIPISTLGDDYFHYDEVGHALVGERSGLGYRLGDRVEVKLKEAIPLAGSMMFEMLSEARKLPASTASFHKSRTGKGGRYKKTAKPAPGRGRRKP